MVSNSLGDEITTLPASSVPTDLEIEEEEELQKVAETQLTDTRKLAENWRNGLAALLALVATIFFVKGRESAFDIATGWRVTLGLILVLAFAAAVWGAWQAMKGAYGSPGAIEWNEIRAEGGWSGYQSSLAESAAQHVINAKWATVVSLGALVVAVLLTWFAPKPSATTLISTTATGNVVVCGKFEGVSGRAIQIEDKEPIPLTEVVSFSVVDEC